MRSSIGTHNPKAAALQPVSIGYRAMYSLGQSVRIRVIPGAGDNSRVTALHGLMQTKEIEAV